ncbi:MAG: hypothetical protein IPK26_20800 [Planctomycetes bacterium]|nr:hypothetical protein [Planctomycetota bacterium]
MRNEIIGSQNLRTIQDFSHPQPYFVVHWSRGLVMRYRVAWITDAFEYRDRHLGDKAPIARRNAAADKRSYSRLYVGLRTHWVERLHHPSPDII